MKNDKNGKNVKQLVITEVVLVHCNIVNNQYQYGSRVLEYLYQINYLVNYQTIH